MNIMEKAQDGSNIQNATEYVFNDIYFGEEGMTKQEAIATNILNQAMKGDVKAAAYIQNLQMRAKIMKKNK